LWAEDAPIIDAETIVKKLVAKGDFDGLVKQLAVEKDKLVERVIKILTDRTLDEEVRVNAARVLGIIREKKAVPALLDNMSLTPVIGPVSGPSPRYCVLALIKIGVPASRAALEKVASEGEDRPRRWLVYMIHEVEGYPVARFLLQERLKASLEKNRENVQAALEFLDVLEGNKKGNKRDK
jgi:hypothetical protein